MRIVRVPKYTVGNLPSLLYLLIVLIDTASKRAASFCVRSCISLVAFDKRADL